MGLFGNKPKKTCPICGGELKFLSSLMVNDGEICGKCEQMIRGQFNVEEYWKRKLFAEGCEPDDYRLAISDPLQSMCIEEIRRLVDSKKKEQTEIIAEVGSKYANVAKVESYFTIAPKPLEVGLKRAKELKNRVVATSLMVSGTLCRGDEVVLTTNGVDVNTKVLDVILCSNSSTFETELSANIGKHRAEAGQNAWIFLDVLDGVQPGTLIQKN